jgi:hypothetical protein
VRFTPIKTCNLKAGKIFSRTVSRGDSTKCTFYVWNDNGGVPGTIMAQKDYTPSVRNWDTIPLDTSLKFTGDFWVGYRIPLREGQDSVYATFDSTSNYPGVNKASTDLSSWTNPSGIPGDLMVRAIVEYQAVEEFSTAKTLTLNRNSPNPVLNKATISYTLPSETKVKLEIYNATGRLVKTLADEIQSSGSKRVVWDKRNTTGEIVSSGIYFYRLTADDKNITKTMIVL